MQMYKYTVETVEIVWMSVNCANTQQVFPVWKPGPQHNIPNSWRAGKTNKYILWLKAFHGTNGMEMDFGETYWSWKKYKPTVAYLNSNSPATHGAHLPKCFIWNKWTMNLAMASIRSGLYALICNHIIKENWGINKSIMYSWAS